MKSKHKTQKIKRSTQSKLFPVLAIIAFAAIGTVLLASSKAATGVNNNPVGTADYCRLEGNTTVIYGWGHDSQAGAADNPRVNVTIGSKTFRTATSIDGYRNADINAFLNSNNYIAASKYGFRATFTGIYKGSSPTISGTIENVQEGVNQAMRINQSTAIAGSHPDKYYFGGNKVPDACLVSAPVVVTPPTDPPIPSPDPNPTPTPTPSPTGPSNNNPTRTPPPKTNTGTATTAPANTPPSDVKLTLNLTLKNNDEILSNIDVKLEGAGTSATTNDAGLVSFTNLAPGEYYAQFDYKDNSYEQTIEVSSTGVLASTIDKTINVSELQPVTKEESTESSDSEAAEAPQKSRTGLVIFLVFLLLAVVGAVVFIIKKRRSSGDGYGSTTMNFSDYSPPAPVSTPAPVHTPTEPLAHAAAHTPAHSPKPPVHTPPPNVPQTPLPTTPQLPHQSTAGVSLKDLVLQSMREEAARRNENNKSDKQ